MVERVTERFRNGPEDKPKVFKNTTVNTFYEFFETLKERNIFQDADLAKLVERAKAILGSESAENIRSNAHVEERIRSGMQEVEASMAAIFQRPRRKIMIG